MLSSSTGGVTSSAGSPSTVIVPSLPRTRPSAMVSSVETAGIEAEHSVKLTTARNSTMPDTLTLRSASSLSFTPGRSTTMFEPWTRTSGSATPLRSSDDRTRSRTTSRSSPVAPSSGARMTDRPPCRSRPRIGALLVAMLPASAAMTATTVAMSENQRRRFIERFNPRLTPERLLSRCRRHRRLLRLRLLRPRRRRPRGR